MEKREVERLRIGDRVRLKYNLGIGKITRIAMQPHPLLFNSPADGVYPMIEFRDIVTKGKRWATYLAIAEWTHVKNW